jgi:hypothetical protein
VNYREKAIHCVQNSVLVEQRRQFEECGRSLDEQYRRYGQTDALIATIIEAGRVYEIGYPQCVCPEVLSGKEKNPAHCECSRQSILYILGDLLPDKTIRVEIIETVLSGAATCRFKVTVD